MQRDPALLVDIVTAARLIGELIGDRNNESFATDVRTYWAVIAQMMIIGEAVKRLSPEFRATHGSVAWSAIARMRDKLIHHYNDIDDEEVFEAATRDIPALLAYIRPLLPPEIE